MNREGILLFALGRQSHLERRTWKGRKRKEEEEEKSCDIRKESKGHRGILSWATVEKKIELKQLFFKLLLPQICYVYFQMQKKWYSELEELLNNIMECLNIYILRIFSTCWDRYNVQKEDICWMLVFEGERNPEYFIFNLHRWISQSIGS